MQTLTQVRNRVITGAILLTFFSSCYRQVEPTIGKEMRDAYQVNAELYGYVWNDKLFDDPKSEQKIAQLLGRLAGDFHRVEANAKGRLLEPGFNTVLLVQRDYLHDVQRRFEGGSKGYAKWRLRSLSQNCIACHSRFSAPVDFIGSPPSTPDATFESKFASAQFLFATRQFDAASERLFALAKMTSGVESGSLDAFSALQLWLAIEVRVKDRYATAATALEQLLLQSKFGETERASIDAWIGELRRLEAASSTTTDDLARAEQLLAPLKDLTSISDENLQLVNSLKASAILHRLLSGGSTMEGLERPTYLLAFAYAHMPVQTFDGLDELFLEQCIRDFPGTVEAQNAYLLYSERVELRNSGSGGLHLDASQVNKLQELRELAGAKVKSVRIARPFRSSLS